MLDIYFFQFKRILNSLNLKLILLTNTPRYEGLTLCFFFSLEIHIAAAKSLQSCPTLCNPIDGSPPGSPIPGILQARTLEWVAISFSNAWKWKVKVKSLSRVGPSATPWTTGFPDSSVHGIFQARILEWGAIAISQRILLVRVAGYYLCFV